jgi:hypothetical protein
MDDIVADDELVAERVLSKWDVIGSDRGEETVNGIGAFPCRAQRVPLRRETRPTDVQPTVIGDVAVRPRQEVAVWCGESLQDRAVVDRGTKIHVSTGGSFLVASVRP